MHPFEPLGGLPDPAIGLPELVVGIRQHYDVNVLGKNRLDIRRSGNGVHNGVVPDEPATFELVEPAKRIDEGHPTGHYSRSFGVGGATVDRPSSG